MIGHAVEAKVVGVGAVYGAGVLVGAAEEGVTVEEEDVAVPFSQGAAMCLQMLRHQPETFACAALLSGFVVPGLYSGDEALAQIRPPVFTGADPADPIIPPQASERLHVFAREHTTLTAKSYPAVGHGISPAELHDVVTFLGEHLPGI